MKDITEAKKRANTYLAIFKKLSEDKQQRALGYIEGLAAHSEKESKSA